MFRKKEKELKKFPRKLKYKKSHRGTLHLINFKKINFSFNKGKYAIKTLSAGFVKWKTLIEVQKVLKRVLKKKKNKVFILFNTALNWPVSRKPKGTRMGKGKGKVGFDDWVCRVKSNTLLLTIKNAPYLPAKKAINLAKTLLPFPSIFIKKK